MDGITLAPQDRLRASGQLSDIPQPTCIPRSRARSWRRRHERLYGIQPGTLRSGENVIVIRVHDGAQAGGIRGDRIGICSLDTPLPEILLAGESRFRPGADATAISLNPGNSRTVVLDPQAPLADVRVLMVKT